MGVFACVVACAAVFQGIEVGFAAVGGIIIAVCEMIEAGERACAGVACGGGGA